MRGMKKVLALAAAATMLVGGGTAFGVAALDAPPKEAEYVVEQTKSVHVEIMDPDNVLSPEDEARMLRDAERISFAAPIKQLNYMVFAKNKDKVGDTVEEYLRDNHPDLIAKDNFPDGQLYVGVGLDPRTALVFAGDDVADRLHLNDGDSHLEEALEEIKPGVKNGNIPAGLFAGANYAADADALSKELYDDAKSNRALGIGFSGLGAGAAVGGAITAVGAMRRRKAKRIAEARENWKYVSSTYGDTAQRLNAIDVRAHSLTSDLTDARMREEWEELRDEFLNLDSQVSSLASLGVNSPDEDFDKAAPTIEHSKSLCDRVETAERNIDRLYAIEHADATVRKKELYELRKDLIEARTDNEGGIADEADRLEKMANTIDVTAPNFMDQYLELLDRSAALFTKIQENMRKDNEADELAERPRIDDPAFYPGVGYHGFVPYVAITSWNTSATAASSSASSSSSANFSSGFSGAGGTSSF